MRGCLADTDSDLETTVALKTIKMRAKKSTFRNVDFFHLWCFPCVQGGEARSWGCLPKNSFLFSVNSSCYLIAKIV